MNGPASGDLRRAVAGTLLPGFVGTTLPSWLERRLRDGLGGVCLFGQNIESVKQVRRLTAAIRAANPDAVIAIDEEGGDVTRLHYATGSPYPGNAVLGRHDAESYTESIGRRVGRELRRTGCTLDFAPDADINSNPDNPVIGVRSFGASTELTARHAAAWTRGLQSAGVAACAKHFPGHGDTAQDSHLALPEIGLGLDRLRERELVPFRAVIEAGVRAVMTSHILLPEVDPENPATFSPRIIEGLLRDELGFTGVVVTDALDMHGASGVRGIPEAAVLALAAGCDLLCIGTENTDEQLGTIEDAVLEAVHGGRLPASRIAEAAARVRGLAAEAVDDREDEPVPEGDGGSVLEPDDIAVALSTFDVSPMAREWLARHREDYSVARVDTVANIAVGLAPWGPFAEAAAEPDSAVARAFSRRPLIVVGEGEHAERALDPGSPVVIIGKDNHRHPFARAVIDALRSAGADILVVDMGWVGADRGYADIATFGASRLVGRALLELLGPDS